LFQKRSTKLSNSSVGSSTETPTGTNAFIRGKYCLLCGKGEGAIGDLSVMNFTNTTFYFLNRSPVTGKPDSCDDDNNKPNELKDMPLACPKLSVIANLSE
jgi:hypothetical protein